MAIKAQITNVGGVPEPASWAKMLAGFVLVGAANRGWRGTLIRVAA
ncbi:PEPxxWA-CTERM sorting domain-containing protein [Sphingomonas bacterium]|nr:PEPxxWA-CTERM sorting domain-containing protein [Sphingomonas bacterium]